MTAEAAAPGSDVAVRDPVLDRHADAPELKTAWTEPRPGGPATRRHYDWFAIREMYVGGIAVPGAKAGDEQRRWPTMAEVADHFGVVVNRIRERAANPPAGEMPWTEARREFQLRLQQERDRLRLEEMARQAVELDKNTLKGADAGVRLVVARLMELGQQQQIAQRLRGGAGPQPGEAPTVLAGEMKDLAAALDQFHKTGARALGDTETIRAEIVGPGGGPIKIQQELAHDDTQRLAGVLGLAAQIGLSELLGLDGGGAAGGPAVIDASADAAEARPALP